MATLVAAVTASLLFASPAAAKFGFLHQWGGLGTANGKFNFPSRLAIDGAGNVYVSDTSNARVQKFNRNGGFIRAIAPASFVPTGIATDAAGDVYVIDVAGNDQIHKFNSAGAPQWTTSFSASETLVGIAADSSGLLWISTGQCTTSCIDPDDFHDLSARNASNGSFVPGSVWGGKGTDEDSLRHPADVAIHRASNSLYVADAGNEGPMEENERVLKLKIQANSTLAFERLWGDNVGPAGADICTSNCKAGATGGGPGEFNFPFGLGTDAAGNVYVADVNNHRIQKFRPNGTYLTEFGGFGTGPGKVDHPRDVEVGPSGDVYIADSGNDRIKVFGTLVNARITKAPKRKTTRRTARFRFKSSRARSRFKCSLKGRNVRPRLGRFRRCNSPKRYRSLKPGRKVFRVQAIDQFGNRDRTPAKRVWRVRR